MERYRSEEASRLVFNFNLQCHDIFLQLMRVCVGLKMFAAYFCHPCQSNVDYDWSFIKMDWPDACIALRVDGAVLVIFLRSWR